MGVGQFIAEKHKRPMKSGVFVLLAILFAVLEHIVEGLIHKKGWASIAEQLFGVGSLELLAA